MKSVSSKNAANYKWVVAAACFLMVFVCLGFCSSNKSIYVKAITDATGISRSLFSINDTVRFVVCAIVNIFFGTLIQKFGPKKLMLAGFVSLIGSMLLYSVANDILLFYLGGALLGIGTSFTTTATVGYIVGNWFTKNRGTVMGAILAANGLGGAAAVWVVNDIIDSAPFGYQAAYRLVVLILAITAAVVLLLVKEQPADAPKTPTIVAKKKPKSETWVGVAFSVAAKKTFFYVALVCVFFTGFMLQGIHGVAGAHMKDIKLDENYVTTLLSISSVVLTLSKFLTGAIFDKFGLRVATLFCSVAATISMVALALISNSPMGNTAAMVYGVVSALALPLETIMLPLYAADLFGEKDYSKMLGIFVAVNYAGYAVGSPVVNVVYDICHSYTPAFIFCAVLMTVVTVTMQFVIGKAHRFRKTVLAQKV